MDSYSGSEPCLFISFRLGNEPNDQPSQSSKEEERMETNESFVTAPSVDEVSPESGKSTVIRENKELPTNRPESSAEISTVPQVLVTENVPSSRHEIESVDVFLQSRTELIGEGFPNDPSGATATPPPVSGTLTVDSSSTNKRCSAYIAREWEGLGDVPESNIHSQKTTGVEKSSLSALLELAPGQGEPDNEEDDSDPVPEVTLLDIRKYPAKGIIKSFMVLQNRKSKNSASRLAVRIKYIPFPSL